MAAAVITADIVNSSTLPPADERKLKQQLTALLQNHRHEFYRGDSFQVYLKEPSDALRTVLQARSLARSFSEEHDIRASIGLGKVSLPVRELKSSGGEAFTLSGRAFDELANNRLAIVSADEKANLALGLVAAFCDFLFQQHTVRQAIVVQELFHGNTQVEAARRLGISQATVNQHARSANWSQILELLNNYQKVIQQYKLA